MRAIWLLPLIALGGCATTPAPTDVAASCLPMAEYTLADQGQFAGEVDNLSKSQQYPLTLRFLGDYKAMRDADRACQKSLTK